MKKELIIREILDSMYLISTRFERLFRQCLRTEQKLEFTPLHLHAATALAEKGHMKMSELAKRLALTTPSTTQLVDKLVDKKVIERFYDSKDRRTVCIKLTAFGKKVVTKMEYEESKVALEILGVLSETELKNLLDIHQKIIAHHTLLNSK